MSVGDGEGVAVPVAVGAVEGGALETVREACAATGGLAGEAEGCAVEAAGWGLAGAGAAAGADGLGDGWGGGGGAVVVTGGGGVGVAVGALTVSTGAGSLELGGPIQRTTSPVGGPYVCTTGIG